MRLFLFFIEPSSGRLKFLSVQGKVHADVHYAFLQKFGGIGEKAVLLIKALGVLLCVDDDLGCAKLFANRFDGILHQHCPVSDAVRQGKNAPDLHDPLALGLVCAQIGDQLAALLEKAVQAVVIEPVKIAADDPLLEQKDLRARPRDLVQLARRQLVKEFGMKANAQGEISFV